MNAEMLVLLLEQHIADIRQSLEAGVWQGFVATLARATRELQPRRESIEKWTDAVCELLMGSSYTKGLLQGLRFQVAMSERGLPSRMACPDPGLDSSRVAVPAGDARLVARIQAVVHRAQTLA
jgi:hypothetical protein